MAMVHTGRRGAQCGRPIRSRRIALFGKGVQGNTWTGTGGTRGARVRTLQTQHERGDGIRMLSSPMALSRPCMSRLFPAAPLRVSSTRSSSSMNDVYGGPTTVLQEGLRKRTFSILVGDETGMINKVSSVFSRRGFNIESLAVGLSGRSALFTVVAVVDREQAVQLVRQLLKLVKVEIVMDVTNAPLLERELALIKVRAPAGATRSEVLEMAAVFRAHVVDLSEATVTLAVTGDSGKASALEKMLRKYGILQLARTGKVALKRGVSLTKADRNSATWAPTAAAADALEKPLQSERADDLMEDSSLEDDDGIYPTRAGPRVWEVSELPAVSESEDEFKESTLSIVVDNLPGVLSVVTGVFTQRGYNIQSLAVGPAEGPTLSRITMVVPGTPDSIKNLQKQLEKKPSVQKVQDLTDAPFAERELMLVRVRCLRGERQELLDLATIFRGRVADISDGTLTVEVTGDREKMVALQDLLRPYGIVDIARTGRVALPRESGVDTAMLQRFQTRNRLF